MSQSERERERERHPSSHRRAVTLGICSLAERAQSERERERKSDDPEGWSAGFCWMKIFSRRNGWLVRRLIGAEGERVNCDGFLTYRGLFAFRIDLRGCLWIIGW